ncbi:hypothetical protein LSTR_LSTR009599 [Laodelphax striatellus]|uniref:Uncharacterized protein n=1 Tax=Laodelphax striatellus TaxID=195883 RepID=A0A482WRB9_LAOST|nr:hypothetical protein LSTR_LSTR009599 [Laodelphax striatellus]
MESPQRGFLEEDDRNSSISITTPIIVNSASTVPTATKDVTTISPEISIGQGEPKRGFSSVTSSGSVSSSSDSETNDKRNDTGREDSSGPLNDPRIFLLGENHHEDLFDQHTALLDKEGRGHRNGSVHSPLVRGNGQRVGDRRSSLTSRFRPESSHLVIHRPNIPDSVTSAAPTLAHPSVTTSTDHRDNSVRHSATLPRKEASLRAFHKTRKSPSLLSHLLAPTAATTAKVVTKRPTPSSKPSSASTPKPPSPSDDDYYLYDYPDTRL